MILDNGVIRTLDPQLPLSRALAVAGDRFAGGVGVHETALASPERIDLRGRCVLPSFTDTHTHFASWASARKELDDPTEAELLAALREGQRVAASRGVTAVHDFDGAFALPLWQRLRRDEALNVRVWQALPAERIDALAALGFAARFGDDMLRLGPLHIAETGGALEQLIVRAAELDFPVAIEGVTPDDALAALEVTRTSWEPRKLRQRIEHPGHLDAAYGARLDELGVTALPIGAVELDPFAAVRAAVLRADPLTIEEALLAVTVYPAWLTGEERRRGKLIPGHLADLVVLDRDPLTCPPEELEAIEVVATMVGGRWVFNPPPWD